jgi:hypothetical protein
MTRKRLKEAFVLIDKITNSVEHARSGHSYETDVLPLSSDEVKRILKKNGWQFSWRREFKEADHQLFKLVIRGDSEIQGLLSIQVMEGYIEMHLIENAPHNYGSKKTYLGVAGNLVAFACRKSFELGFDGYVSFTAKTQLVDHYKETLGAESIYRRERMAIPSESARKLVSSYYKDYFNEGQEPVL